MQPTTKTQLWLGRAITSIVRHRDKLMNIPAVDESFKDLGYTLWVGLWLR